MRYALVALSFPLLMSPQAAHAQAMLSGRVLDEAGKPLAHVYVRQAGTLTATFTDAQGRYSLPLTETGEDNLLFSASGYHSLRVSRPAASTVVLAPLKAYQPTFQAIVPTPRTPSKLPLSTKLEAFYQFGGIDSQYAGNRLSGAFDNQLSTHARYRHGEWLLAGQFDRMKVGVSSSHLPSAQNPALIFEQSELRLRVGRVWGGPGWEVAPSLGFLNFSLASGVAPVTGTPYDYSHGRRALGLEVPFSWSLPLGLTLEARGSYYPSLDFRMDRAPYQPGAASLLEAGVGLGVGLTPTMRLEARMLRQMSRGSIVGDHAFYGIGLAYYPEDARP